MLKPAIMAFLCAISGPAAFRRLCVETTIARRLKPELIASRLQAAVC